MRVEEKSWWLKKERRVGLATGGQASFGLDVGYRLTKSTCRPMPPVERSSVQTVQTEDHSPMLKS